MRNLLALLAFGVLVFGGAGWYLDWYKISTTKTADGDRAVTIEFDKEKIKGAEGKFLDSVEKKVKTETDKQLDTIKTDSVKKLD